MTIFFFIDSLPTVCRYGVYNVPVCSIIILRTHKASKSVYFETQVVFTVNSISGKSARIGPIDNLLIIPISLCVYEAHVIIITYYILYIISIQQDLMNSINYFHTHALDAHVYDIFYT